MSPTRIGSATGSAIAVSDSGAEPLQLGSLAVQPQAGGGISLSSDGCSNQIVEPGQTCTARVDFAPTTGGPSTATVRIPSDQGAVTVPVSGVAPSVSSLTSPQPPALRFRPISADGIGYGQRLVVVLSNPLSTPVYVGDTTWSGTGTRQFAPPFSQCAGETVPPGASCRITLLFEPTRAGSASARLTVSGDGLPLELPLTGWASALPRVSWIELSARRKCLSTAVRERVRVVVSQTSQLRWRLAWVGTGAGRGCAASHRAPGAQIGGRSWAAGRAVTSRREQAVLGRRGYPAAFKLPRATGVRPGTYRLTVIPTNPHGSGAPAAVLLDVVGS
jgi:hypothetical protein